MDTAFLSARLQGVAAEVDAFMGVALTTGRRPERLVAAMRHAVFAGGKRMRPYLVMESARLFGVEGHAPLCVATALEAVHCYSLVHDDLPSMDDDDMRRGQPTVHRAYDEATAILAGDALLTLAFSILTQSSLKLTAARKLRLVAMLAEAAGLDGMVGGQMLDLAAEGRFAANARRQKLGNRAIRRLQALKTGALIEFAVLAGAVLAPRTTPVERRALAVYGRNLGLAFQIRDDLLDIEGEAARVGKALAKDEAAGKATFVALLGIDGARRELDRASDAGRMALQGAFGNQAGPLCALLDFNRARDH
ncbi:MAG: farnesyl diphosphate [Beijerinckiaceae bacterium]|nr:MAG: farnesyl diphosphate [Beijerinckiaceae bacterium]